MGPFRTHVVQQRPRRRRGDNPVATPFPWNPRRDRLGRLGNRHHDVSLLVRQFRDWPENVCAENPHKYGTEKDPAVPIAHRPDF
jgi:hypothetical protein